jgi:hypothetical protein
VLQRRGEREHGRNPGDVPREVVGRAVPATRTGELSHKRVNCHTNAAAESSAPLERASVGGLATP